MSVSETFWRSDVKTESWEKVLWFQFSLTYVSWPSLVANTLAWFYRTWSGENGKIIWRYDEREDCRHHVGRPVPQSSYLSMIDIENSPEGPVNLPSASQNPFYLLPLDPGSEERMLEIEKVDISVYMSVPQNNDLLEVLHCKPSFKVRSRQFHQDYFHCIEQRATGFHVRPCNHPGWYSWWTTSLKERFV